MVIPCSPALLRSSAWRRLRACATAVLLAAPRLWAAPPPSPAEGSIVEQPLAPRSGPRGQTLFALVPPEQSGVVADNKYDDPDMWGRRSREFDLGGIGTGVAIGDFDGDGRPDLFVVSKTESCRLFRNLGNWKFEDVTEKAGVADHGADARVWKQGAAFVDINNDGLLDIYVCRFDAPNLLYINQGDGTFKEQAHAYGLDVKDACVMAVFGDYDRDGWLDVFIQTNVLDASASPEGQRDYLFHNNHDGTFTNVTDKSGIAAVPTHGNSALWWDFDGDGWPDLYVANDFAVPDALYRNNHDGTFTNVISQVIPHSPYSSMGSDFGDVAGNGRVGLFVADMAASEHVKDQRTMAETRARMRIPPDGSSELRQYPVNALYVDTGTGHCLEAAQLAGIAGTDWTWSPRFEDLDEDGRTDLHLTNGMYREIHNQDLIAKRMTAGSPMRAGQIVRDSAPLAETHFAFRNLGDLQFRNVSAEWGLDQKGVSFGSAFGDLDGDGDLDLVYSNYQAGPTLLRNDNDTGHHVIFSLRGTQSNRFGLGAKLILETAAGTQVRVLSPTRGFMSSSEPILHFGLGESPVIQKLTVYWPSGVVQSFTNLAVDRRFTLTEPAGRASATASASAARLQFKEVGAALHLDTVAAEEGHDEFIDQRLLPMGLNRRGPAIAIGNVDGSGQDGVCIGGTTRQALRVMIRQGDNGWSELPSPAFATPPEVDDGPILLFDSTGQNHADLLVTAGGNNQPAGDPAYQPRLYLNDGHGHFQPAPEGTLPTLSISAGAACAADFDRDGHLDVFIGARLSPGLYPTAPASALLAWRGGKFVDVTDSVAPGLRNVGMVTGALWSDVDGDGWLDLVLTLDWGEVKYFHNSEGKKFEDWTERSGFASAGIGWWRSLASADFNGDGRPDYVVGNLGLNTEYRADPEHPALLFVGDFAGRGSAELVEAYYENGQLYPRRSRNDLGAAIPTLIRRYRSNNDFAKATLPEILGADKLAAATRLAATQLQSGVLLSQPDGRYQFAPLPRIAQIAPANGIVTGDFDGDGHTDIYLVQNDYSSAPAHGRFDGGLSQLLCGDGHGKFQPVPADKSGLVVPGDARAVALLDLNGSGQPGFLVSRNGASALAFQPTPLSGSHLHRLRLQGESGNPTAIGAKVTAEFSDGSQESAEISAGSGFYSQSTSSVFLNSTAQQPLTRIRIRWPSGKETSVEGEKLSADIVIREHP